MNRPTTFFAICWFIMLVSSCAQNPERLSSMVLDKWKSDHNGCNGYRKNVYLSLFNEIDIIKGNNESKLIELLGKPNTITLYVRGQKFYIYQVRCASQDQLSKSLKIRFNALGLVSEMVVVSNSGSKK